MPFKDKIACSAWNKEWRIKNSEILREKRRIRRNTERGKLTRRMQYLRYRQRHRDEILKRGKIYQEKNREACRESCRKSYRKHWSATRAKQIAYEKSNQDRIRQKRKVRRQTDPQYRIRINVRRKIAMALQRSGTVKSHQTHELIGCSIDFLKRFLENQFKPSMTWENHGRYGWHIDHKIPCCSFNLLDLKEQHKCFNYSNLQPLWAFENLTKGAKC